MPRTAAAIREVAIYQPEQTMKFLSRGNGEFAYLIRLVDGREIRMSYMDDDRAMKAALKSSDFVLLILADGRELKRADLASSWKRN